MSESSQSLPEALARQIRRVTEIRCHYRTLENMPGVYVKPAMFIMDQALDKACHAIGSPDIAGQIRALQDLEVFSG